MTECRTGEGAREQSGSTVPTSIREDESSDPHHSRRKMRRELRAEPSLEFPFGYRLNLRPPEGGG